MAQKWAFNGCFIHVDRFAEVRVQSMALKFDRKFWEIEMTQLTFSLVTAALFSVVALLHAVRLLRGSQVTVEGAVMPVWISWIGLAIAAYLAYQGFRLSKAQWK